MEKKVYTIPHHLPYARIRTVIRKRFGDVQSFVVKLEYNVADQTAIEEDWEPVARFDHNPESETGHDIRKEGLHMDVCIPNGDDARAWGFPDIPVNQAPDWCEKHFKKKYIRLSKAFCNEYGIDKWNRPMSR